MIPDPIPRGYFASSLKSLRPGEGKRFKFNGAQPYNRRSYLQINAAAYYLWGSGGYWLHTVGNEITVMRRPPS